MFTLPHNTIAYLYKEAIDMRLGMFRLQGVIAQQLSQPMAKGASLYLSTSLALCSRPSGLTEPVCACSASALNKVNSAGHNLLQSVMKNGCKSSLLPSLCSWME